MNGSADAEGPLAIVCAGGTLPFTLAEAARRRGRGVFLYALRGWADPEKVAPYPHEWGGLVQFGRFFRCARRHGCRDVVFIGTLVRPSLWRLRPDLTGLLLAPRIVSAFRGGDDHLLSALGRYVEENGFRIVGAHEIAPELLVDEGPVGSILPSDRDRGDIAVGLDVLGVTGRFDIGQAVVVAGNRVLAVEAAEGTDRMLERLAALRRDGAVRWPAGTGVLVKAPKPGQNTRIDLPSVGPKTVEMAAAAALAGIAVAARGTIIAEPQSVAATADRTGLFVIGVMAAGPGQ